MNLKALDARYKLLFIPYHLVLEAVWSSINGDTDWLEGKFESLNRTLQQLPDGTEVQDCHKSETRTGLVFKLWHESFDIVGQSEEIPEIEWENYEREIRDELIEKGYYPYVVTKVVEELPPSAPRSEVGKSGETIPEMDGETIPESVTKVSWVDGVGVVGKNIIGTTDPVGPLDVFFNK